MSGAGFLSRKFFVDSELLKTKILHFVNESNPAILLDSNSSQQPPVPVTGVKYQYIAASGVANGYECTGESLTAAGKFIDSMKAAGNWVLGSVSYDIKNEIEDLTSRNSDAISFPSLHFFVPEVLFIATRDQLEIISCKEDPQALFDKINEIDTEVKNEYPATEIISSIDASQYYHNIDGILKHIQRGDIYEMNYCCEIKARSSRLDVLHTYSQLTSISPNPFSCFYKTGSSYLLCASPERFICKTGNTLLSQPIKGTAARDLDQEQDLINKELLRKSEKERSENVMIVDLVRNDLSRIATRGSVITEELFGVYSFTRAHQMISTVSCKVKNETSFEEILRAAFPMGSMTGAPKISAMKLIDQFENFKRGIFSGTVGYIDPTGDFDFNVVIRSIRYNRSNGAIAIAAGGAITALSTPAREFEEMKLKMLPQLQSLGIKNAFSSLPKLSSNA